MWFRVLLTFGIAVGGTVASVSCAADPKASPTTAPDTRPTLWIIGDSTVHVNTPKQMGWGDPITPMFDASKIRVVVRAIGGRSSRTFITDGRWDAILGECKPGDYVLMQFGHNDSSALAGDNRERGTIRGIGEESQEVTLTLGENKGKKEVVHTYGWYMRKYVTDAKAHGMKAIICSPIPRCPKPGDSVPPSTGPSGYVADAKQVAEQTGASYVDLNERIWAHYTTMTPAQVKDTYFTGGDTTHTGPVGARQNAEIVVAGLKALTDCDLKTYILDPLPEPTAEQHTPPATQP
ncbi:MAG: rhamnogalacturonan acetylesterase [Tepidisphaeraceae bacterium]